MRIIRKKKKRKKNRRNTKQRKDKTIKRNINKHTVETKENVVKKGIRGESWLEKE